MQIPNLLNMAMKVVGNQQFTYIKNTSRFDNGIGLDVANYAQPQVTYGQVQAVPRELLEKYGLDFQGNYIMVYVSKEITDVTRDVSGDEIQFKGITYQVLSKTDWFNINGWTAVICVQINS